MLDCSSRQARPFWSRLLFFALGATVSFSAHAAVPAGKLPTQEEIHQLFDQNQQAQVLQKIAQVLALKGEAAKPYDRHDLLWLKAEAHLRLKAYDAAERAFVAAGWETDDPKLAALDLATSVLVRRSRAGQYQSTAKVNGKIPDTVSVIGQESRKLALQALFRDELAVDGPKITAVRDVLTLDPICQVAPLVTNLKVLEMGATGGSDDETRGLISELAKHAQDMMGDTVHDLIKREAVIVNRAHEMVEYYVPTGPAGHTYNQVRTRERGYDVNDRKELDEIRATCNKIAPAARALGDAMGPEGIDLVATSVTAARLAKHAGS
jgi:hypothetical protein